MIAAARDGALIEKNLNYADLSESWVKEKLQSQGVEDLGQVTLAQIDSSGKLHVFPKPAPGNSKQ